MISGWREFGFFEVLPIRDPNSDDALYSDPNLLALAPGTDTAFLSTRGGEIKEFDQDMRVRRRFRAAPDASWALEFLRLLPNSTVLVSVATKQGQPAQVSLWDLKHEKDKKERSTEPGAEGNGKATAAGAAGAAPKLLSTVSVVNGSNTFPLTTFTVGADASVMALGYADGAVIVVRGDVLHDRGSRQRRVYTASSAVTGLYLIESSKNELLYMTALGQVVTISTTGKQTSSKAVKVLDKADGAEYGCTALLPARPATDGSGDPDDELVIAREAKIAYYSSQYRGRSLNIDTPKKALYTYLHYLVLVTVWQSANTMSETESLRLVILDTRNNLVAFNGHIPLGVKHVFTLWGRLNVVGADGLLYTLKERSLESQLEILTQQQLFQVAISLGTNGGASEREIKLLHQQYGDYLQSKDDSDNALKHYMEAIDLGNTSHVILKYKESQNIKALTAYLEALVDANMATPQHLTLLMVCYANLGDIAQLGDFLSRAVELPSFDFQAGVDICRNAKYFELASFVAEKWPDPDLVVQIKLRDMQAYNSCLDYIVTVTVSDVLRILIQNSRLLLNELPVETTGVLITLFTGKYVPKPDRHAGHDHVGEQVAAAAAGSSSKERSEQLESITKPVLQSYQAFINYISSASYGSTSLVNVESLEAHQDTPSYLPPRPRLIFPSFIGHDNEFVIFLEACLEASADFQPARKDLSDIVTTLHEVYLRLSRHETDGNAWRAKAEALLRERGDLLDSNTVLMVAQSVGVHLSTEQQLSLGASRTELLRGLLAAGNVADAVEFIDATKDKADRAIVVPTALRLAGEAEAFHEALRPKLTELLEEAAAARWLTPAQIVNIVCANPYATVADLKPFLLAYVERENKETAYNAKIEQSYRTETEAKQAQLAELEREPVIVQYGNCSLCATPLDLPAVHFACRHSYHQRCLGTLAQCPIDLPEQDAVKAALDAQRETANIKTELFLEALGGSRDRLRVINDYIARGALSDTP